MGSKFLICFCLYLMIMSLQQLIAPTAGNPTARKLGPHIAPAEGPGVADLMMESGSNHHHHRHHRGVDKSVAGGGVILGGLATTFLVAVFCYIRATKRKGVEQVTPTNSDDVGSSPAVGGAKRKDLEVITSS